MSPRIAFVTLGCRVNQYDGQALAERLGEAAFERVPFGEPSEVCVINTCTVTAAADAEARVLVRRARASSPGALVVVTGCLAQDRPDEVAALEGVDLVVGNSEKSTLIERIVGAMRINDIAGASYMAPSGVMNHAPTGPVHEDPWLGGISRFEGHRRAFLKVQDGCDFGCSFCLIPRVRGTMVSRPLSDILEEGRRLAGGGVRELVLAGIQLSSYGRDLGLRAEEPRLAPVVEGLLGIPGVSRVRLSSYAVADFEDALLPLWRDGKGLCAHLHLPLQSGNEGILRAMRRPYSLEKFRATVAKARAAAPGLGLTSDILAGFPGETEAAFQDTLDRIREFRLLDFHPFPYSDRPGTPGETMTPKTDPRALRERMGRLLELRAACRASATGEALGREARVIVERHGAGLQAGLTDEGLRLLFPERAERLGEEARVKVTGFLDGTARAEWVGDPPSVVRSPSSATPATHGL